MAEFNIVMVLFLTTKIYNIIYNINLFYLRLTKHTLYRYGTNLIIQTFFTNEMNMFPVPCPVFKGFMILSIRLQYIVENIQMNIHDFIMWGSVSHT